MQRQDTLKRLKLATELIVEAPNTTTPMKRLAWIKKANELLNLKPTQATTEPQPDPEPVPVPEPEKEEIIFLKQVIDKVIPDLADTNIGARISQIVKENADDKDLIVLSQKAVDTYKKEFMKKAKRYQWSNK